MLKAVWFFSLFWAVSCAHTGSFNSQAFQAPRDKVWEALVAVLKPYPLKIIDERLGYIETERLEAGRFWKAPYQKDRDLSGYSSVIKVRMSYRRSIAKVFIDKKVYRQKGFMSSQEEIPSDFLEETVLLYRLATELGIRSRLERLR